MGGGAKTRVFVAVPGDQVDDGSVCLVSILNVRSAIIVSAC